MYYDQDYINGLGVIRKGRRSAKNHAGRKPAKRATTRSRKRNSEEDDEEEPRKNQKDIHYRKRKYPFENVDTVSEAVKLIRRFVNLTKQKIELHRLAAFIRALQKAIVQRIIRKRDPHAKDIAHIQELAIEAYHNARGKFVFIDLSDKLRDKYYAIGRGERVRGSVAVLKRFVGLIGQPYSTELKKRMESIGKSIAFMFKKGIILKNDPYYDKVKEAFNAIKKAYTNGKPVVVSQTALNGLSGILEYEQEDPEYFFEDGGAELNGIDLADQDFPEQEENENSVPAALTGEQYKNLHFDSVSLPGFYGELLAKPARNFFMLVYGPPWHGKSAFVIGLSKCIAENVGRVAYVSPEQHGTLSQQQLARMMNALDTDQLEWYASLLDAGDLRGYACIVIDSGTACGLTLDQATDLHEMLPGTMLIVILQSTKDDDFKGEQGWRHIPDIVLKVKDQNVNTEKNRYRTDAVSLPIPLQEAPSSADTQTDGNDASLNGPAAQTGQIEITALFDAPLQWIAENLLHKAEGVNIGNLIEKKPAPYEKIVRQQAEIEISETSANVRLSAFRFSFLDRPNYYTGTAYFEATLKGTPEELQKVAGDNGNTVFIFKWNAALNGAAEKPEAVFALGAIKQSEIPEVKLRLTRDTGKFSKPIHSSRDIATFVRSLFEKGEMEVQEQFIVLYFDRSNNILGYYKLSKGGINSTIVDSRLVFVVALKALSTAIALIHNHPSAGPVKPSEHDIRLTRKLKEAGDMFDIRILDHVILGVNAYYSFADEGLI